MLWVGLEVGIENKEGKRMKVVIEIPDGYIADGCFLNNIQNGSIACGQILKAVKNGTPYRERPKGRWIPARGTYYCSCCRHYAYDSQRFDFCQDCGAEMKGD